MKSLKFFDPHLKQYIKGKDKQPIVEQLKHTGLEYLFPNSEFSLATLDERVTPLELQKNHPDNDRMMLASGKRFAYTDPDTVARMKQLLPSVKDSVAYGSLFLKECSAKNEQLRVKIVTIDRDPYEVALAAETWKAYQETGTLLVDVDSTNYLAMGYTADAVPQLLLPKAAIAEWDSNVLRSVTPGEIAAQLDISVRKIELAPHNFVRMMQILVVNDETGENSTTLNPETDKYEYGFENLDKQTALALTGDGHGKVSNDLAAVKFGTDDRTAIQVRMIAKNLVSDPERAFDHTEFPNAKIAKGSVVAHDLASLSEDGQLDAVCPTSFFKGGDKVKPGLYNVSVWMGEIDRSKAGGQQSISSLIPLYADSLKEIIPKLEPKMANLSAIQNDPIAVARSFCDNFEQRQERLKGGESEAEAGDEEGKSVHQLPTEKYDVIRKALDTGNTALLQSGLCAPTLIDHLRTEYLNLAIGKDADVKFDRGFAVPSKELAEGEICVPWLKDGVEVITYRAPLINTNGVHVLTNKYIGEWDYSSSNTRPNYILCNDSLVSASNERQQSEQVDMGRDYDGDSLGVLAAAEMPILAEAVKAKQADRYRDNIKLPKAEFTDSVSLEQAALQAETAPVGIISNALTKIQGQISAIDMVRDFDGVATDRDRLEFATKIREQLSNFNKWTSKKDEPLLIRPKNLDGEGEEWFDRLEKYTNARTAAIVDAPRFDLISGMPESAKDRYDLANTIKSSMYGFSKNNQADWCHPPASVGMTAAEQKSFADLSERSLDINKQVGKINKVWINEPRDSVYDSAAATKVIEMYQQVQKSGADLILETERELLRDLVGVASFQNQIAVSMKKSATVAQADLVQRLNHFLPSKTPMMLEKKNGVAYTDAILTIDGITPPEILADRVNHYFQKTQIKVEQPACFKSLFDANYSPEVYGRMLDRKLAFDADWNYATRLSSKAKNEEGCVLNISDNLGRKLEVTNLCKFDHDLVYNLTDDTAALTNLRFRIEPNRWEEMYGSKCHLDTYHKYVVIAEGSKITDVPPGGNDIFPGGTDERTEFVIGTLCEFSRKDFDISSNDKYEVCSFKSAGLAPPQPDLSAQYFEKARDTALKFRADLIEEQADIPQYAAALWHEISDKKGISVDDPQYQAYTNSMSASICYFFPDELSQQIEINILNVHRVSILEGVSTANLPIDEVVQFKVNQELVTEEGVKKNRRFVSLATEGSDDCKQVAAIWENAVPLDASSRLLTGKLLPGGASIMLLQVPEIKEPIVFGMVDKHYLKDRVWVDSEANISFEPIVKTDCSIICNGKSLGIVEKRAIDLLKETENLDSTRDISATITRKSLGKEAALSISIPQFSDNPAFSFDLKGKYEHGLNFGDGLSVRQLIRTKVIETASLGVFLTDDAGAKHQIGEFTTNNTATPAMKVITPHATSVKSIAALVKAGYIEWEGLRLTEENGATILDGKANRSFTPVILKDPVDVKLINSGKNFVLQLDPNILPERLPVVQQPFSDSYIGRTYANMAPTLSFDSTLGVMPTTNLPIVEKSPVDIDDPLKSSEPPDTVVVAPKVPVPNSMKIVISGSMSIQKLPEEAIRRIDAITQLNAKILVGDAPGVDTEVQKYLKSKNYENVTVYHAYEPPRNHQGFTIVGGFGSSTDRDKAMCAEADYGLAIWDGKSQETKANIDRVPSRVVIAESVPEIDLSVRSVEADKLKIRDRGGR